MKLSIVIPFHNARRTLPMVVERLRFVDFAALGLETELIFVDDGSTDGGATLLDRPPRGDVRVLVHPTKQGKGAAVTTGLAAATGDVLCIQDVNPEHHPGDLPWLLRPILDGTFDVVYGRRFKGGAAGLSATQRNAGHLVGFMANLAHHRHLQDVYTGPRLFTRRAADGLRLTGSPLTLEEELASHFLRKGLTIVGRPNRYGPAPSRPSAGRPAGAAARGGAPKQARRWLDLTVVSVLSVAVAAVGLLSVLQQADRGTQQIRRYVQRGTQDGDDAWYSCLERSLRSKVPAGARVAIFTQYQDDADYQQLSGIATPWYRLVAQPRPGDWVIAIVDAGGRVQTQPGPDVWGTKPGPDVWGAPSPPVGGAGCGGFTVDARQR